MNMITIYKNYKDILEFKLLLEFVKDYKARLMAKNSLNALKKCF